MLNSNSVCKNMNSSSAHETVNQSGIGDMRLEFMFICVQSGFDGILAILVQWAAIAIPGYRWELRILDPEHCIIKRVDFPSESHTQEPPC